MSDIEYSEKAKNLEKGKYKHFKGNEYEVIDIAFHSETLKELVVYKALYGDGKVWARPIDMFLGKKKLENGKEVERFEYLG